MSSSTRLGPLWQFFHTGEAQNSKHKKAYCRGCVEVKLGLEPEENSAAQRLMMAKSYLAYDCLA